MFSVVALPRKEEPVKLLWRNRLDLGAQPVNRQPVNAREQPAIAPLLFSSARTESSAQDEPFGFQGEQCGVGF
jgi:hypothetical protein